MPEHTHWQLEEQDFWNFSLTLYAQPGVMENCLMLQDDFHLNVNMILFCCFAEQVNLMLDEIWLTTLHQAVQQSETHIAQHRQQRKQYKQKASINQGEMFDQSHYQLLKQQELTLEKQQQADLIASAQAQQTQLPLDTSNDAPNTEILGLALYVTHFARSHSLAESTSQSALSNALTSIQGANRAISPQPSQGDPDATQN